jgi:hypothetical protein
MTGDADVEPIELGDESKGDQSEKLEKKYQEQMRQIVTQKIELPISTLPEMLKEQINLSPEFQRRDRWNVDKQSRFIESVIMNVPVPPVFLGENEYGTYVVLDGRQRLTAISEFLKNTYKLKNLEVWDELNNKTFEDLIKRGLDKTITRRFLSAVVVLKESSTQVKYDVFDRLNTGGVPALPMEIRNAVFQGPFNKALHLLSADTTFRRLWDIPTDPVHLEDSSLYNKMRDLELILRFFALRDYENMALRFEDHLGDYMEQRNKVYAADPLQADLDRQEFTNAITNSWTIFGPDAFRRPLEMNKLSRKSAPLADSVMVALRVLDPSTVDPNKAASIRNAVDTLCNQDQEFRDAITKGTNGKGAIKTRIEKVSGAIAHLV